ncbi:MAG: DUF1588 domain-containing protein [Planctomycetota bacterium]
MHRLAFQSGLVLSVMFVADTSHVAAVDGPQLLAQYCLDCHDASFAEGDYVLQLDHLDWSHPHTRHEMERVHQFVSKGIMPPADFDAPTNQDRSIILRWLDENLRQHSPVGGMTLRRLSAREYANSIRSVFGLSSFELPIGFPPDTLLDGFDNQGNTLVMAASHLEAFADSAANIADQMFPPPTDVVPNQQVHVPAKDLVVSYSSAFLTDGEMRLASSGTSVVRHATWPSKFEAPASGVYEVTVKARSYVPNGINVPTPILRLQSSQMTGNPKTGNPKTGEPTTGKSAPDVVELELAPGESHRLTRSIAIDRGGWVQFRYPNGPFDYEDKEAFQTTVKDLFTAEPRLAAAWEQIGSPPRGGSGWDRLKQAMSTIPAGSQPLEAMRLDSLVNSIAKKNSVSSGETLVYKFFEEGPYVAIESVTIRGPVTTYEDRSQAKARLERERFVGKDRDWDDEQSVRSFFDGFLEILFRRPPTRSEVDAYCSLVRRETRVTGASDRGMHLAVRTALISPAFLYREVGSGQLDDFELASRLSYFLTSGPPDAELYRTAADGVLSRKQVLQAQTRRLLRDHSDRLVVDFASAWLGLDAVDRLMPDTRLIRRFTADHREGMKAEVYQTLQHAIDANLPVRDLIAPDFVFTNGAVGRDIYGIDRDQLASDRKGKNTDRQMRRVSVASDDWRGGLLTMPAVMMATANGVDTQPVLRGVWVLSNILGSPPPEPPKAVPALTPDTAGATSPRDLLARHMSESSCAACHRDIDPVGFVLESFDAIGRWRDRYPKNRSGEKGLPVETAGQLPDGTQLSDVTDLKRYLANAPRQVAQCITEKLMTYASGRKPNYTERHLIEKMIDSLEANEYPLRDLIETLVLSDLFQVK